MKMALEELNYSTNNKKIVYHATTLTVLHCENLETHQLKQYTIKLT